MSAECIDSNVLQVLIAVVIGGLLTGGSTLIFEWYKNSRDAKRLAKAFCGEILALQDIVRKRHYIEDIRKVLAYLSHTNEPYDMMIRVRRRYFLVYENNVDRIGELKGELPEKIASFYVRANAILEDLGALEDGVWSNKSAEEQKGFYSELLDLLEELCGMRMIL